ncbi:MAG: hypothetical protein K8L97_20370, partial [Anaerolineae bacterium]|nr:hypothetical protein [Anaerolineae bacterium]
AEEASVPDWLSDMQPDESAAEPEPVAEEAGGFEWMSSAEEEDEEPLAEEAVVPDWMSAMQPDEPAAEPEPVAKEAGGFEWMSSVEEDEPDAEEAAVPDWMSAMQPDEPAAEPVAEEAGGFEWMSSAEEEDEPLAEEAGVPDWMSAMQPDESAAEPVAEEAGGFEWMSSAEEDEPDAEPVADSFRWSEEPVAATDTPDWLSQLEQEDEAEAEQPIAAATGSSSEWMSSVEENDEPAVVDGNFHWGDEAEAEPTADMPDWLSEMQPDEPVSKVEPVDARTVVDENFQWSDEAEAEPVAETPDWLRSIQSDEPELEPELEAEAAASSEFTWIDDINASDESQPEFDDEPLEAVAELEDSPVGNAPDWLNAMVPGLDVDFEAPEDEQIEREFAAGSENRMMPVVPETPRSRSKRDFDWLVDIVDNETRPMTAVDEKAARRRFSFTRQPAWLRPPTEKQTDADDIDLPPWLQ